MTYKDYFKGKRITLMGLGLLGRGVGDAKFLAEHCEELIVTDLKSADELKASTSQLLEFDNITYRFGEHNLADFQGRDLIVKSAGIPLQTIYTDEANKNGIPIAMSTALFAKFAPATIIGITGTKGKSTTTNLIFHTLKKSGIKVHLGGNVQGVSTLAMLPEIKAGDVVVLELDSWQLQGFHTEKISPQIAVFTNLLEDHMNYYKGDMSAYFYDKSAIFSYQKESSVLITQASVLDYASKNSIRTHSAVITVDDSKKSFTLPFLPGKHNQENATMAYYALQKLGIPEKEIEKHFTTCTGLPGRLQFLCNVHGIDFYNDTNATIPDATIMSLKTLKEKYPEKEIILLTGGTFKDVSVAPYAQEIPKYATKVVLLEGTGTEKLLEEEISFEYSTHNSLLSAFTEATKDTPRNSIILFSPAFSSFGMFKNEYDRGEQFNTLVENYSI